MNHKKVVKEIISEIIQDQLTPTMKYYAFDWDDNLMYMPTKIYLKDEDGNSVGMSTEDFAEYRSEIGKEPFEYEGHTIVGFDDDSFRDFRVTGDKQFLNDAMKLSDNNIMITLNLAHAELLKGDFKNAKELYLKFPLDAISPELKLDVKTIIINDFEDFKRVGVNPSTFDLIRKELGI